MLDVSNAVLSDLALLLLTQLAMQRSEALLCILRMFSCDPQEELKETVDDYKDRVYLDGNSQNDGLPALFPLVSTARHQGALRIHAMLRMLTRHETSDQFDVDSSVPRCLPTLKRSTIAGGIRDPTKSKRATISSRYRSIPFSHRKTSDGLSDPFDVPIALEGWLFFDRCQSGWIPTAWILSAFLNPELLSEQVYWSPTLSIRLIDQMLIRGDSTFALFFLLALFQHFTDDLIVLNTADTLEAYLSDLPWLLDAQQLAKLIETATIMEKIAPISVVQSLRCVSAQCASGLLPDALPGDAATWRRRYEAFMGHMLLPREWTLPLEGNELRFEHTLMQWTGVYRILSRDLPYLPCPSMSAIAGTPRFWLTPRLVCLRLSPDRRSRGHFLPRPSFSHARFLLFGPPSIRRRPGRSALRPRSGGTHMALPSSRGGRDQLSPRA